MAIHANKFQHAEKNNVQEMIEWLSSFGKQRTKAYPDYYTLMPGAKHKRL